MIRAGLLSLIVHGLLLSLAFDRESSRAPFSLGRVGGSGVIVVSPTPERVPKNRETVPVKSGGSLAVSDETSSTPSLTSVDNFVGAGENEAPTYPAYAMERGWEGEVRVKVEFSDPSRPPLVSLVQSSGFPVLDEEVLSTAKRWTLPERLKGESAFIVPIEFKLIN